MKHFPLYCLFFLAIAFTACEPETPVTPNEEEVITTLTYKLTPSGGGTAIELKFQDLDGEGGNAPTITGGTLAANTTYTGEITLLNEQENPAEDVTLEIKEEDKEHQFFFPTTVNGLTVTYGDVDGDGKPVGLKTEVVTTAAGSGNLQVILKHEPDKNAAGVSGGDMTNAGGETDIEVTFPVTVQ